MVALLFAIILPVLSAAMVLKLQLFDLFSGNIGTEKVEELANPVLALVFLLVPLAVAYCAYTGKYLKYAGWAMLLPFLWLLGWKDSIDHGGLLSVGSGAWIYLVLTGVEILLILKPDLLDNLLAKKQQ